MSVWVILRIIDYSIEVVRHVIALYRFISRYSQKSDMPHYILVYFSVLVLSDECDESDELLVTVISIQCCVCTR